MLIFPSQLLFLSRRSFLPFILVDVLFNLHFYSSMIAFIRFFQILIFFYIISYLKYYINIETFVYIKNLFLTYLCIHIILCICQFLIIFYIIFILCPRIIFNVARSSHSHGLFLSKYHKFHLKSFYYIIICTI